MRVLSAVAPRKSRYLRSRTTWSLPTKVRFGAVARESRPQTGSVRRVSFLLSFGDTETVPRPSLTTLCVSVGVACALGVVQGPTWAAARTPGASLRLGCVPWIRDPGQPVTGVVAYPTIRIAGRDFARSLRLVAGRPASPVERSFRTMKSVAGWRRISFSLSSDSLSAFEENSVVAPPRSPRFGHSDVNLRARLRVGSLHASSATLRSRKLTIRRVDRPKYDRLFHEATQCQLPAIRQGTTWRGGITKKGVRYVDAGGGSSLVVSGSRIRIKCRRSDASPCRILRGSQRGGVGAPNVFGLRPVGVSVKYELEHTLTITVTATHPSYLGRYSVVRLKPRRVKSRAGAPLHPVLVASGCAVEAPREADGFRHVPCADARRRWITQVWPS